MAYSGKTNFAQSAAAGSGNERSYLNALFQFGLPSGNILYVHSVTGVNGAGYGFSPLSPFASLDYALGKTRPDSDDWILLLPNHVETLTAAGTSLGNGGVFAGPTLSNGVTVLGLGNGRNRPTFNYTTAITASFNISAANFTIKNCVFTPTGFGAITAAMNVTGADFSMEDCEWQISTGTNAPVLGILTAATAARLKILRSRFLGPATSTQTCTACIQHEVGIDFVIKDCEFTGKMTQAILNATTLLGGLIDNNRFVIATGTKAIAMAAASTPFISNNRINVPSGTAPIVAAAGFVAGNIYSAAAGVTAGTAATI